MGNYKSVQLDINKGVPQGSLLGPLLFLIFINDIVEAVDVETVMFADDAAFFLSAVSLPALYSKINALFSSLSEFSKENLPLLSER